MLSILPILLLGLVVPTDQVSFDRPFLPALAAFIDNYDELVGVIGTKVSSKTITVRSGIDSDGLHVYVEKDIMIRTNKREIDSYYKERIKIYEDKVKIDLTLSKPNRLLSKCYFEVLILKNKNKTDVYFKLNCIAKEVGRFIREAYARTVLINLKNVIKNMD